MGLLAFSVFSPSLLTAQVLWPLLTSAQLFHELPHKPPSLHDTCCLPVHPLWFVSRLRADVFPIVAWTWSTGSPSGLFTGWL